MTVVDIAANLEQVQETIAAACARVKRDPDEITLVAVSKTKPVEAILAALAAGVRHLGENRVEEAEPKIPVVNEQAAIKPVWHMIGYIQSRKAKLVTPLFDMVHSIDRLKIARKLSELMAEEKRILPVLIEVNISGEEAKSGFEAVNWKSDKSVKVALWRDMETLLNLPHLEIRGLMTMAPYYAAPEDTRPVFAGLAELRDTLQQEFAVALPELSMGMTNDYAVAVEEGATIVRVGRAVFGERP